MHILILPSWYFPSGSQEIAGRMFLHLAQGLREESIDARILYCEFSFKGPFQKRRTIGSESNVPTWRVNQWFPPRLNSILFKAWIKKCTNEIEAYIQKEGKPDLIHAHSYPMAAVCTVLQKKILIPFVYTERLSKFITGDIPEFHIPYIKNSFAAASVCTCVSPGLKSKLQSYTTQPIEIIPNYFDDRIFYPDPQQPKTKSFTWVSIGEPAYMKGIDLILHAFALIKERLNNKEMQLMLIDHIPEEKYLTILAEQLKIKDDIIWTGLIPQNEIATRMRQSHALISASRVETFGKAIVEAQACGLPVVATKTDGAEFIISHPDQGELTAINDVDELSTAMEKVYLNFANYDAQKINSRVVNRFSQKIVLHQWERLYESIIA